jgi:hypothetical protein
MKNFCGVVTVIREIRNKLNSSFCELSKFYGLPMLQLDANGGCGIDVDGVNVFVNKAKHGNSIRLLATLDALNELGIPATNAQSNVEINSEHRNSKSTAFSLTAHNEICLHCELPISHFNDPARFKKSILGFLENINEFKKRSISLSH